MAKQDTSPAAKPESEVKVLGPGTPEFDEAVAKAVAEKTQSVDEAVEAALRKRRLPEGKPIPDPLVAAALAHSRQAPLPALSVLAKGEKTKMMVFPRRVLLTLADHSRIAFEGGPQEVPESLVNHPYLKQHGVKAYVIPAPAKETKDAVAEGNE